MIDASLNQSTIDVDCRSERQTESRHILVDFVVRCQTVRRDRQRRGTDSIEKIDNRLKILATFDLRRVALSLDFLS